MQASAQVSERDLTFEREVVQFRKDLYPVALRMTRNPSDAEDLVQETMTRAYVGIKHFTPGTNARAWLFRIMSNTFINTCRKRKREPVHVLSGEFDSSCATSPSQAAHGRPGSAPSAESEVLEQFTYSDFREALAKLPESFRTAIYLADVEGYSYKDIADMVGVPLGTVMSRLSRARKRLRVHLAAYAPATTAESVAALLKINRFRCHSGRRNGLVRHRQVSVVISAGQGSKALAGRFASAG
jgi:RNA polymerase sigma-70 factor, ECF subfamily